MSGIRAVEFINFLGDIGIMAFSPRSMVGLNGEQGNAAALF